MITLNLIWFIGGAVVFFALLVLIFLDKLNMQIEEVFACSLLWPFIGVGLGIGIAVTIPILAIALLAYLTAKRIRGGA